MKKKNVVAGLGEIGLPIKKIISRKIPTLGYDIKQELINKKELDKYGKLKTCFLHICIPFSKHFFEDVKTLYQKFQPECIVIHTTISPSTTKKIQSKYPIPIIFSPIRGIHKRMIKDLKRYTKFYSLEPNAPKSKWASTEFVKLMKKCDITTKKMSTPLTLELAKIVVDTSYYGWLINYAQLSNMVALKNGVDYNEMWTFSDEIHKFLGNRPKMFPGFIGGHCVIPNLDLINDKTLNLIKQINKDYYLKYLKKGKK